VIKHAMDVTASRDYKTNNSRSFTCSYQPVFNRHGQSVAVIHAYVSSDSPHNFVTVVITDDDDTVLIRIACEVYAVDFFAALDEFKGDTNRFWLYFIDNARDDLKNRMR
jgi:hypothetical protein